MGKDIGGANSIVYTTNDCLCKFPTDCATEGSIWYSLTRSGLDRMLQLFFSMQDNFAAMRGANPTVASTSFMVRSCCALLVLGAGERAVTGGTEATGRSQAWRCARSQLLWNTRHDIAGGTELLMEAYNE